MALKLSILIAGIPKRDEIRQILVSSLVKQLNYPVNNSDRVEIIIDPSTSYNIGTKRNLLLNRAIGDYIVFIDDDDTVSADYISKILQAIETGPDCVGISGTITTNGQNERQWHISKEFKMWYERGNVYYRTPNHISPVKRELALQVGFPETAFGEDAEYSSRLLPLLKTETIVKGNIYHYDFRNDK